MTNPQPNTQRDRATEDRILDAAHSVFTRRGTAGARVQEIAAEAGVNKALLHYYFRSKEKLASAVFQRVALQIIPPLMQILASDAEIEVKVEKVVNHYLDQLSRAPYLPAYLIAELNHHPERVRALVTPIVGDPQQVRPRVFAVLAAQLEQRVAAGTLRPIAAEQFVINLVSLCIFPFAVRPLLETVLLTGEGDFERFIAARRTALVDFFLAALRP